MVGRHDSAAGAPEQPREMTHPCTQVVLQVVSSQLPAPQLAPRTKVVLQSRQFSSSSSPDTPRTKVVLESRQFSSSSSPDAPRTKVAQQSRQSSPQNSCTAKSPVLIFQLPRYPALKWFYNFASSHLPPPHILRVLKLYNHLPALSPEGCPRQRQIALSPAFRALDAHDLRRGLRFAAVRRHCPGLERES